VLADTNLIDITEDFVKASKWQGGFELEFIRTVDDKLVLLEVNPSSQPGYTQQQRPGKIYRKV
jgi:hypothetical protein